MNKLEIKNLTASIYDSGILDNFSLTINEGEIHAIMGPNGTGKSTLSKVIMGDPTYTVNSGEIIYKGTNILDLDIDKRAHLGIFLGMQMPTEIEGVSNADFLRAALTSKDKDNFKLMPFINDIDKSVENLKMNKDMVHRSINVGFSGGERKKNEILQMHILKPSIVMLDEIDSGLDVDSLKIVGENVTKYYNDKKPGILLVTHYQRLLDYIKPDFIHIMVDGKIVKTGDISLVSEIESDGYKNYKVKINKKVTSIGSCAIKEKLNHE